MADGMTMLMPVAGFWSTHLPCVESYCNIIQYPLPAISPIASGWYVPLVMVVAVRPSGLNVGVVVAFDASARTKTTRPFVNSVIAGSNVAVMASDVPSPTAIYSDEPFAASPAHGSHEVPIDSGDSLKSVVLLAIALTYADAPSLDCNTAPSG